MGTKTKMNGNEEKNGVSAPLSARLASYGLNIMNAKKNASSTNAEKPSAADSTFDDTGLFELLHDVVRSEEELRILAIVWIQSTFPPRTRRDSGLDSVREILHEAFDPTLAFSKSRHVDALLQRGVLCYQDTEPLFGPKIDPETLPLLQREIMISKAFLEYVTQCDEEHIELETATATESRELRVFHIAEVEPMQKLKIRFLKKAESDISLKNHFLEPELEAQIHRAAHSNVADVRMKMQQMGVYRGPAKMSEQLASAERNVILLYGPPGTGKTSAAFAIAGELNTSLYTLNVDNILSSYFGQAEKNIRAAFEEYRSISGALGLRPVMLMDECDSLMRRRHVLDYGGADRATTNIVNIVLQEIEAFRGTLVMTTNAIDMIDEAFARRVSHTINIDYPSAAVQRRMWKRYLEVSMKGADCIDIDALLSEGTLTGALIVKCVSEVVERLLLRDGEEAVLTTEDLVTEIRNQLQSFDRSLLGRNPQRKTAFGFV